MNFFDVLAGLVTVSNGYFLIIIALMLHMGADAWACISILERVLGNKCGNATGYRVTSSLFRNAEFMLFGFGFVQVY